jgi:hypothetical protein
VIRQVIPFAEATPEQVKELVREWPRAYVECRMDRHEFRPSTATHYPSLRYIYVIRLCHRCRAERHEQISDQTGELFDSQYRYNNAPGYLIKGRGRIVGAARDQLRLEAIMKTYKVKVVDEPTVEAVPWKATRAALSASGIHYPNVSSNGY